MAVSVYHETILLFSIISAWFGGQFFFSRIALAVLTNLNRFDGEKEKEQRVNFNAFSVVLHRTFHPASRTLEI